MPSPWVVLKWQCIVNRDHFQFLTSVVWYFSCNIGCVLRAYFVTVWLLEWQRHLLDRPTSSREGFIFFCCHVFFFFLFLRHRWKTVLEAYCIWFCPSVSAWVRECVCASWKPCAMGCHRHVHRRPSSGNGWTQLGAGLGYWPYGGELPPVSVSRADMLLLEPQIQYYTCDFNNVKMFQTPTCDARQKKRMHWQSDKLRVRYYRTPKVRV